MRGKLNPVEAAASLAMGTLSCIHGIRNESRAASIICGHMQTVRVLIKTDVNYATRVRTPRCALVPVANAFVVFVVVTCIYAILAVQVHAAAHLSF